MKSHEACSRQPDGNSSEIPITDLPSCRKCHSLVRPHVVWFGEPIGNDVMNKIQEELDNCDLFLVVSPDLFSSSMRL